MGEEEVGEETGEAGCGRNEGRSGGGHEQGLTLPCPPGER